MAKMKITECCNHKFIGDNHSPIRPDGYCLNCGFHPEIEKLKEANKVLTGKLNESVNILKDGCLVYDQFVPSGSSSFRSDAQWFIDSMAKADEIMGEKK